jgi:peptide deformylase
MFEASEGCLSCFNLRAPVSRHVEVSVTYRDECGEGVRRAFADNLGALVQHEIDHLDGILFIDRVKNTSDIATVDYLLSDRPERLKQVKEVIEFVVDPTPRHSRQGSSAAG